MEWRKGATTTTQQTIYLNFSRANAQADTLERLSRALREQVRQKRSVLGGISAGWQGENAQSWLEKGKQICAEQDACAKSLENAAGRIRRIARHTYQAELRALELAARDDA